MDQARKQRILEKFAQAPLKMPAPNKAAKAVNQPPPPKPPKQPEIQATSVVNGKATPLPENIIEATGNKREKRMARGLAALRDR